jgi:hypothetical protein
LVNKTGNIGFGNLTGLRLINTTTTNEATTTNTIIEQEESTNQYNDTNTKIMKITYKLLQDLRPFSKIL